MSNNTKFKKGQIPYNKGIRKYLDLEKIYEEHKKGKSILDISKEIGVSDRLIRLRLKEKGYTIRKNKHSKQTKKRISETMKRKGIKPKERYSGKVWNKGLTKDDERVRKNIRGLLKARKNQIFPIKDSKPEKKIQEFLMKLNISFFTHQYMRIEHSYQCDILIPIQEGIKQKTIIECDGDLFHYNPKRYKKDDKVFKNSLSAEERWKLDEIRTKELIDNGFRVIRIWESNIKKMNVNDLRLILTI